MHVCYVVLQLKARQVVIDILKNQVDSHEGAGSCSFSLHHKTESWCVLKIQAIRALYPNLTCVNQQKWFLERPYFAHIMSLVCDYRASNGEVILDVIQQLVLFHKFVCSSSVPRVFISTIATLGRFPFCILYNCILAPAILLKCNIDKTNGQTASHLLIG